MLPSPDSSERSASSLDGLHACGKDRSTASSDQKSSRVMKTLEGLELPKAVRTIAIPPEAKANIRRMPAMTRKGPSEEELPGSF